MSIEICKVKLTATCLSMTLCALAVTGAHAGGQDIIIDQAIHDYADHDSGNYARGSFSNESPRYIRGGYHTLIVLDEAYHDYDKAEVETFNVLAEKNMEKAEFAAFEQSSKHGAMFADIVPWEINVTD